MAELAVVTRSGFVESRHFGTLVGLASDGSVAVSLGTPEEPILPRSSTKPWQAAGCRAAGLVLSPAATALSAGSHTGEDRHVAVARAILADAGLSEEDLQCVADWPEDEETRLRLIRAGEGPSRVRMNCSGKHAAMLACSVVNGWSTEDYLSPDHPVQKEIRARLEEAAGPVTHVAVDGCGAPLFSTTVLGLARATRSLVLAPAGSPERAVADAMRAEPEYVGGAGHQNTDFMRLVPGTVCKGGAEGVLMAAAATGQAVAMKVIDGNPRATTVLALAVLGALGVDVSLADTLAHVPVLGGGHPVGEVVAGPEVLRALA
ncbi:asparaginase [Actinophytocola oryzae]|uniref:Asparaginase n=1 Tax=Actinophytocola oryzae TaxID=502181 RepID=A0A4R7V775_9PSEU|nr:asparaginase [Actinophytocola oryzae]TDV44804.1 asparaginase [Actinophytocola oryzae]